MTRTAPNPYEVYQQIKTLVGTIPQLGQRIYVGHVPDTLPTVNGYTLTYCVIWPGAGTPVRDRPASGQINTDGQHFPFTTSLAATDPTHVLRTINELKRVLTGARIGDGQIEPDQYQQESATLLLERDISPARHYLPLAWGLQVTRLTP